MNKKSGNPKNGASSNRLPAFPHPLVTRHVGLARLEGNAKYGRDNFLFEGADANVYLDAAMRHMSAWAAGMTFDMVGCVPIHHLAKAIRNLEIMMVAQASGMLENDPKHAARPMSWPMALECEALVADLGGATEGEQISLEWPDPEGLDLTEHTNQRLDEFGVTFGDTVDVDGDPIGTLDESEFEDLSWEVTIDEAPPGPEVAPVVSFYHEFKPKPGSED